ncbi:MAG: DUF4249 family protein [Bacteroidales bacterium]|nr:DUF4249 family protein [Bacteroidales bacterium]
MKKLVLVSFLSFFICVSCEYEIDYNADLPEDRLVVAAILEENEPIAFRVYHSAKPGIYTGYYYDDIYKSAAAGTGNKSGYKRRKADAVLKDASVTLFDNKNSVSDTAEINANSEYTFSFIPKTNDDITIRISHNNYSPVESRLQFNLPLPQVDSFSCSMRTVDDNLQLVVYLEINDKGGENYYMINNLFTDKADNELLCSTESPDILYESHAGVYYENNNTAFDDDDRHNEYHVFNNEKFAGGKYILKLAYNTNFYITQTAKTDGKFDIDAINKFIHKAPNDSGIGGFFEIATIDKNTYNYLYSLGNYINSWGLGINPVAIKNAWENGYGFIGMKKSVKKTFN